MVNETVEEKNHDKLPYFLEIAAERELPPPFISPAVFRLLTASSAGLFLSAEAETMRIFRMRFMRCVKSDTTNPNGETFHLTRS